MTLSSLGFLMNMLSLSLNLFFNECHKYASEDDYKNKEYKIKVIKFINTKFCLNDKYILFSKFNPIYSMSCKEYIESNKAQSQSIKYNIITKLFFISHSLMNYVIPTLMKLYMEAGKAASMAFSTLGFNNPQTKEHIIKLRLFDIYIKNEKFVKQILEFNEITTFFLITLNNSKYTHNDEYTEEKNNNINSINEELYSTFKSDYYKYIDTKSNAVISSLPEFLIINMVNTCVFFRQAFPDLYFKDFDILKNLANFGLIYSSRIDIIHNQHLRSQIFDILLYSFHLEEKEKNNNHLLMCHQKLLKDEFIRENLILSIMRVFIDAERLGTSNQFYERFNVRNKVLQLVNEVFKKNQEILIDNIINYANKHSDDATQMLTLLMGDVTYLIDEVIQRLIDIRNYQELKDNKELWNSKTDEQRTAEDNKFAENDRMLKAECRLLNHSLGFMTIICSCLQKYFIKEEKAERLANLLNYCLDEFTAKSSQLKIKNKNDYEFNPSYIMESIIKIFSYFVDYEEFIEFVVSDERAYKYENFTKAIKLKNEYNKVRVDVETSEKFDDLVYNKLKKAEEIVEKNTINYDDAPEEFLDPLTYTLMENPVILPSSHMNIDRRTIEDYLLTNPSDPFNRNPLTKDELIPNEELKKKIDEYKLNKFKEKQKNFDKKNKNSTTNNTDENNNN
jgi:ubiquitin conjugation factor E4 B